jgi:hypothetical protein
MILARAASDLEPFVGQAAFLPWLRAIKETAGLGDIQRQREGSEAGQGRGAVEGTGKGKSEKEEEASADGEKMGKQGNKPHPVKQACTIISYYTIIGAWK